MDSILLTIKKMLGIEPDYSYFDSELIVNINSVLMILNQIGVINDRLTITGSDENWADFILVPSDIEAIKSYIYLRVRLLFDPPSSSFVLESMERQIREFEWRFNTQVELREE